MWETWQLPVANFNHIMLPWPHPVWVSKRLVLTFRPCLVGATLYLKIVLWLWKKKKNAMCSTFDQSGCVVKHCVIEFAFGGYVISQLWPCFDQLTKVFCSGYRFLQYFHHTDYIRGDLAMYNRAAGALQLLNSKYSARYVFMHIFVKVAPQWIWAESRTVFSRP